jgi:hypothetical protein
MRKHLLTVSLLFGIASNLAGQADSTRPQWRRIRSATDRPMLVAPTRNLSVSDLSFALAKSSIRTYPTNRPHPRRHFGPFHSGSHIDAIKILVNTQSVPSWYFTDYLTQHPNTKIRSYFPAGFNALGNIAAATPRHIPGAVPTTDGIADLQLSMQQLSYSGRYGGSVRMTFVADETFEYDARSGTTAWDFSDLTIRVYVVPSANTFNSSAATVGTEPILIEVEPTVLATYQLNANSRVTGADTTDRSVLLKGLETALIAQIGSQSGAPFRRAASAFVYGYVHDLFSDRLTGSNVVAELQLDEGFIDPIARTGTPFMYAAFRVSALEDMPDVGSDLRLNLGGCLINDPTTGISSCDQRIAELRDRTSTSYWVSAVLPLSDCHSNTTHVMVNASITEIDLVFDDRFTTGEQFRAVDCGALQSMVAQQQWGSYDIYRVENVPLREDDGTLSGLLSFEIRISLENR